MITFSNMEILIFGQELNIIAMHKLHVLKDQAMSYKMVLITKGILHHIY